MRTIRGWRAVLVMLACLMVASCGVGGSSSGGGDPHSYFHGKTITFMVPFSPGGGYDTYARLIAPYLERELGATVVVQNRPGAGGLLAVNNLITQDPDGRTIAIMNGPGAGGASLAGSSNAQFKLDGLSYLGLFSGQGNLFVCGRSTPMQSFQEVRDGRPVRIGSTGPGAADFINANVISSVFGLRSDVVTGFAGSSDNALAVTRGDVDCMAADYGSDLANLKSGDHKPLLTIAERPLPGFEKVPMALDQTFSNAGRRDIMRAHIQLVVDFERPIVAPPGMDPGRLQVLRDALAAVAANPDFRKQVTGAGYAATFLDGKQTTDLVGQLLKSPPAYVAMLKTAYQQ
jgi:tripartite-type tricarboxylate transporter receptor subunit TctC